MKKILNIIALPVALLGASLMIGCEEDLTPNIIDGNTQPLVYVNTMNPDNIITAGNVPGVIKQYVAVYPPTSGANRLYFKLPATITNSVASDVEVTFEVDKDMFESYNELYGATEAKILPEGISVDLGSGKVTIPAGKLSSRDSIEMIVTVPDASAIADGVYVIPVKIASVSGGAKIANVRNTIYVPFGFYASNIFDSRTTVPSGTAQTSFTSWAVTSSAPTLTNPNNMLSTSTSSYATLASAQQLTYTIDMASARSNVAGFRIYVTNTYRWSKMRVETSTDNVNWTVQGEPTLVIAGTNFHYIAFRQRVPSVRYVRMTVLEWPTSTTSFRIYYNQAYW